MRIQFIVSVKAFGDFVIACHSLRKARRPSQHGIELKVLAGQHLADLAQALRVEPTVRLLRSGSICPPVFDVRKAGVLRATKSLLSLRRLFQSLPRDSALLFDTLSWRESIVSLPLRRRGLEPAPNIYLAFEETLKSTGFELQSAMPSARGTMPQRPLSLRAGIFPASRIAAKRVPAAAMSRVIEQLAESGFSWEIVAIEGEPVDLPSGLKPRRIERTFQSLISAIVSCDLIVSADSLPAHLAEYYGVPSFVVSPRPNAYWLPLSAFRSGGWCLFEDADGLRTWLDRHFTGRFALSSTN
jgi:hypothetical protein